MSTRKREPDAPAPLPTDAVLVDPDTGQEYEPRAQVDFSHVKQVIESLIDERMAKQTADEATIADRAAQTEADAWKAAEAEASNYRKEERVGSERIQAYASLLGALMNALRGADDEAWKAALVPDSVKNEIRRTLVMILKDVRRMADFSGNRNTAAAAREVE